MSWKDVTKECEIDWDDDDAGWWIVHKGILARPDSGYRVTRISGPLTPHVAFIVEKDEGTALV